MNLEISAELEELRRALRRFTTGRLEPLAREIDRTGEVPQAVIEVLRAHDSLGKRLPAEFGGGGHDLPTFCLTLEEFGRSHRVFTLLLDATSGLNPIAIAQFGTDRQKEKYLAGLVNGSLKAAFALTEPDAGSDLQPRGAAGRRPASDRTQALHQRWRRRRRGPGDGVTDPVRRGKGGITAFLVDRGTPGFTVTRVDTAIGSAAIKLAELTFEACQLPDEAVLDAVGQGFQIAMTSLTSGRLGVACACTGAADRLNKMSAAHAKQRTTFGKPLADRQAIQWMLADSATEIAAARALTYETLRRVAVGEEVGAVASMCKLFCSEMVGRVADRAVQIHGGMGLVRGFPVERFYRDIRHYRVGEGTSEIQRMLIARDILR